MKFYKETYTNWDNPTLWTIPQMEWTYPDEVRASISAAFEPSFKACFHSRSIATLVEYSIYYYVLKLTYAVSNLQPLSYEGIT